MRYKESKTRVRHRVSRAGGVRKAANQQLLPLVIFKLVSQQVESIFSVRKPKGSGSPPWIGSLRWRSGKPRYLRKQSATRPLRIANDPNNRGKPNAGRKLPGPMLLKAHVIPALPKTPASAAPFASNARPTPEIGSLPGEVGLQVVGNSEVVVAQVVGACAAVVA